MTVTAQEVFVMAMNLMDEESQDGTYEGYPEEYKKKSWSVLTMLTAELLQSHDPSIAPIPVTNAQNVLQLDDSTCLTTLPYGLAAHLIMEEDQTRAAYFNARYDELKRFKPIVATSIIDVYSVETIGEDTTETPTTDFDGGEF